MTVRRGNSSMSLGARGLALGLCLLAALLGAGASAEAALATPDIPVLWALTAPEEPRVEGATGVVYSAGLIYLTSYSPTSGDSSLSILNASTHEFVGSVADPRLEAPHRSPSKASTPTSPASRTGRA